MHVRRSSHAVPGHSHHAKKHDAGKKHAQSNAPASADTFTAASKSSSPQRSTQVALDFISAYDRQLGLSGADLAGKRSVMAASPLDFFRATPSLFARDLKTTFAAGAQLTS